MPPCGPSSRFEREGGLRGSVCSDARSPPGDIFKVYLKCRPTIFEDRKIHQILRPNSQNSELCERSQIVGFLSGGPSQDLARPVQSSPVQPSPVQARVSSVRPAKVSLCSIPDGPRETGTGAGVPRPPLRDRIRLQPQVKFQSGNGRVSFRLGQSDGSSVTPRLKRAGSFTTIFSK